MADAPADRSSNAGSREYKTLRQTHGNNIYASGDEYRNTTPAGESYGGEQE